MKRSVVFLIALMLLAARAECQRRPPVISRKLADPGPNRIEVRFAQGEKAVTCKKFYFSASVEHRVIVKGQFSRIIEVPTKARDLPRANALELEFKCGTSHWHFTEVPETVFQASWWWVGTDYPPFQETFQGWKAFQDAAWIHYLIVDPQGFFVERHCPRALKDQKPSPCDEKD